MSGAVAGAPRTLLRLEGLAVLVAATGIYFHQGFSGWLFAGLVLVPDLSMLGYLAGRRIGAAVYNLGHSYGLPLAGVVWGLLEPRPIVLVIGLIWAAHIGLDRLLGYGLKYGEGFGVTHLGRIGRARRTPG